MIKNLSEVFPGLDLNGCVKNISDTLIEIYDCYTCTPALQRSYVRTLPTETLHFTIINPNSITLTFAALDNCLFGPGEETRCDFMIGNPDRTYFVEIKEVRRKKNRQGARSKAMEQLSTTISYFKARTDLSKTDITAIICLAGKEAYPIQSAAKGAAQVAFKERHGHDLREGRSVTF